MSGPPLGCKRMTGSGASACEPPLLALLLVVFARDRSVVVTMIWLQRNRKRDLVLLRLLHTPSNLLHRFVVVLVAPVNWEYTLLKIIR